MTGAKVVGPILLQVLDRLKKGEYVPLATELSGVKDIGLSGYGFVLECLVKRTGSYEPRAEQKLRAQNIEKLKEGATKVFAIPIWTFGQCSSLANRIWEVRD